MSLNRRTVIGMIPVGLLAACVTKPKAVGAQEPAVIFESFAPQFAEVIDTSQAGRLLSSGHWWAEGPAWDRARKKLYFTDVPRNIAYSWSNADGISTFLDPSGVNPADAGGMREPGANGLLISKAGELLICNHGKRAIEAMDLETGKRRVLCDRFQGKRFNSPNDVIQASDGTLYFTDPPYGLEGLNASPMKEMDVNGVYRLRPDGELTRIVDDMTLPNGVLLSPDETTLYVAQSDPDAPLVRAFDLSAGHEGDVGKGKVWFDASPYMQGVEGLPDGMAVSTSGHLFVAGPGGVLVLDPQGQCLGRIATESATANCAFGEDGKTLFITAQDRLLAVRTRVAGYGKF